MTVTPAVSTRSSLPVSRDGKGAGWQGIWEPTGGLTIDPKVPSSPCTADL